MPITLAPLSRRRFLAGSIAAAAAMLTGRRLFGAGGVDADPHRFALLSDIHVSADKTLKAHGVTMAEHLQQALAEVLQLEKPPACAIVNGDCAYLATRMPGACNSRMAYT
ncbi:MAG TPA: hypothetical protein VFC46_15080 [Humisphaera sp.]|nr:hypothetical protein [Humisphaera sp.]